MFRHACLQDRQAQHGRRLSVCPDSYRDVEDDFLNGINVITTTR